MQFQPKTESEIREASLAPDGEYDFDVLEASDKTSKSGNQMIAAKIGVYGGSHVRWHVYDYLLPLMEAKLRHFCDTTGLLSLYESGRLRAEDCVGRSGKCRIKTKKAEGQYGAKNVVDDYVVRTAKPLATPVAAANPSGAGALPEDDIPF